MINAQVHKAQGSEYPVVVMPIIEAHYRNLLYSTLLYSTLLYLLYFTLLTGARADALPQLTVHGPLARETSACVRRVDKRHTQRGAQRLDADAQYTIGRADHCGRLRAAHHEASVMVRAESHRIRYR